jgi:hypothetical protein
MHGSMKPLQAMYERMDAIRRADEAAAARAAADAARREELARRPTYAEASAEADDGATPTGGDAFVATAQSAGDGSERAAASAAPGLVRPVASSLASMPAGQRSSLSAAAFRAAAAVSSVLLPRTSGTGAATGLAGGGGPRPASVPGAMKLGEWEQDAAASECSRCKAPFTFVRYCALIYLSSKIHHTSSRPPLQAQAPLPRVRAHLLRPLLRAAGGGAARLRLVHAPRVRRGRHGRREPA